MRATSAGPALLQLVRAGYGGALLIAPGPVIRAATRGPDHPRARAVARVLGARHLLQAALTTAAWCSPESLWIGVAVDLAHAASMAALAADRRVRRLALTDALVESTFAAAGGTAAWPRPA